uniref:hypothetical protein n=1 Tax=Bacillus tuaregi TaxID=1816695 RepID=UPI0008F87207
MGEKLEIISKVYLSLFGITRAEEQLFITNAKMRTLFGRTNINAPSRFIKEIPAELLEGLEPAKKNTSFRAAQSSTRLQQRKAVMRPAVTNTGSDGVQWKVGDRAEHGKWGVGTVVSVKGSGDGTELDIAFPSPTGIKRLLAQFAPIKKKD